MCAWTMTSVHCPKVQEWPTAQVAYIATAGRFTLLFRAGGHWTSFTSSRGLSFAGRYIQLEAEVVFSVCLLSSSLLLDSQLIFSGSQIPCWAARQFLQFWSCWLVPYDGHPSDHWRLVTYETVSDYTWRLSLSFRLRAQMTALCWKLSFEGKRDTVLQGCTNPQPEAARAATFYTVAPNICGSSVWNLLHVTLMTPTIVENLDHCSTDQITCWAPLPCTWLQSALRGRC
jgi:hypothetical protein